MLVVCMVESKKISPLTFEPGPDAGIVLKSTDSLLITKTETVTMPFFVRFDFAKLYGNAFGTNRSTVILWLLKGIFGHVTEQTTLALTELQKFTYHREHYSVTSVDPEHVREKRQVFALGLGIAAAAGSIFNLGWASYNAVNIKTIQANMKVIQEHLPKMRDSINNNAKKIEVVTQGMHKIVTVLNTQSEILNKSISQLLSLKQAVNEEIAFVMAGTSFGNDFLREITSSVECLCLGRVPPFLVTLETIKEIILNGTGQHISTEEAHLVFIMGTAITLHVDPEKGELAFLLSIPVIQSRYIYSLKEVINLGFWHRGTHVRIKTPDYVAFHEEDPNLYVVPNLKMCHRVKEIHYVCPSSPFVDSNVGGLCGIDPMTDDSVCMAEAVNEKMLQEPTISRLIEGQWLVNTAEPYGVLSFLKHGTSTEIKLPNQTFFVSVAKDAVLHIGEMALYHVPNQSEVTRLELSNFFKTHTFSLDTRTEKNVLAAPQKITLKALDKEIMSLNSDLPNIDFVDSWSKADSVLSGLLGLIIGGFCVLACMFCRMRKNRRDRARTKNVDIS